MPVQAVLQNSDRFPLRSNSKCPVLIGREISLLYSIGFARHSGPRGRGGRQHAFVAVAGHTCQVSRNATRQHSAPTGQQRQMTSSTPSRCCTVHSTQFRCSRKFTTEHRRNRFATRSQAVMTPCGAHYNRICLSSLLYALWVEASTSPLHR